MAARKVKNQINLLPQEELAGTTLGRILRWGLSTFRIIVIITEMVVMLAFLSRFWLDARNVDLNDLIKQKIAVLATTSDFENEFRSTQDRLKIFSSLTREGAVVSAYLTSITSVLPADVSLVTYAYNAGSIQVKGAALTEMGIAQFIVNLENAGQFEKVEITNLDSSLEEGSLLNFTLRLIPGKGA
jgi:Tfp pilus assembly protein PilN